MKFALCSRALPTGSADGVLRGSRYDKGEGSASFPRDAITCAGPEVEPRMREILIDTDRVELEGALAMPAAARGIVIFAHGSGSSRLSPRNQRVAHALHSARLATLLFDLLTAEEDKYDSTTAALRFDISLLARRLLGAVDWSREDAQTRGLPIGLFGASTGAAAALVVAAQRRAFVRAVVSRGGRPDLAGDDLARVRAPTLLIVGGLDPTVLALNTAAARDIPAHNELVVVSGASHLFEERGALDRVAALAADWFTRYLRSTEEEADEKG